MMESFESKYNRLLEEYEDYAEECYEDGSPILESIFTGFCNYFIEEIRDMSFGAVKDNFDRLDVLCKLMAYKHLKDNKIDTKDYEEMLYDIL